MKILTKEFLIVLAMISSPYFSSPKGWAKEGDVRIVSPAPGQQFAPGETVEIDVEIPAALHATDGQVGTKGLGTLEAREFTRTHFKVTLVIPDYYAGPLELFPSVMAGDYVQGAKLMIHIQPQTAPQTLIPANRNYFLSPTDKETQLYVTGKYQDISRDLTSSISGTTYVSSAPTVIAVDPQGLCQVIGKGLAVITIENKGVRTFVMIVVEDPYHPNPPADITHKVSFKRGIQQVEENGHRIKQLITITNTTDLPIVGPLFLVAGDVPDGARAYGDAFSVEVADGLNLFPGESATAELVFLLWRDVKVDCTLKLYDHDPTFNEYKL